MTEIVAQDLDSFPTFLRNPQEAVPPLDFSLLFDSFPVPAWLYDRQSLRFLVVNQAAVAQYGFTQDEFLALTICDIRPATDAPYFKMHQARQSSNDQPQYRGKWRHQHKDGTIFPVEVHVRHLECAGRSCGLVIAHDLTVGNLADSELRVFAEELRQSREMLATLLRNFPSGSVSVFDHDLRYRFADGQGLVQAGLSADGLIGKPLSDLFPPESVEQVTPYYRRALAGEEVMFELSVFERVYEVRAAPLYAPGEKIEAIIVVAQDISQRKQAEQERSAAIAALQTKNDWWHALTEHSKDVITVTSPEGTILYESPSVATVLGYSPEELIGTKSFELTHPDDLPKVLEILSKLTADGSSEVPDRLLYRYRHKDGSWRWLESTGSSQIGNPDIQGFVSNSRDVTESVRLQKQIIQTEKLAAMGELVAGVAHEINNPLAAISGHAQLLRMHPDAAVREDAHSIERMVKRASRIVHSLRSYASPSNSQRKWENLNDVVASALDVLGHKLRHADIDLILQLAPELPPVCIHAGEIEQILVNLLANAEYALRERSPDHRRIQITTRVKIDGSRAGVRELCALSVQDTGGGIPETVRARIFDPFFTTKDTGEGTGLGLYISHGILVAHGGSIDVESDEGIGTTFTLFLPTGLPN